MPAQYKCLSLTGSMEGNHINSYRYRDGQTLSVRGDLTNTGTYFVKLWVRWDLAQPNAPANITDSWNQLRNSPQIAMLDAEIKAANNDNRLVILTLSQYYPLWSNTRSGSDGSPQRDPKCRWPNDVSTNGPYGWFIAFLCERYRPTSPTSPNGAFAYYMEPFNEPNWALWPQYETSTGNNTPLVAAAMMDTAYKYGVYLGGPYVIGPATSDVPEHDKYFDGAPATLPNLRAYGCLNFTYYTANYLDVFGYANAPARYMGWSHHNYRDVKYGLFYYNGKTAWRVRHVHDILKAGAWWDLGNIWLTEGGYEMEAVKNSSGIWTMPATELTKQADFVDYNYRAMEIDVPEVLVWTQHQINNPMTSDLSKGFGLRGTVSGAAPFTPKDPPNPLYTKWKNLVGV